MNDWLTHIQRVVIRVFWTVLLVALIAFVVSLFYALTGHVWTNTDALVWCGMFYLLPTIVAYGRQSAWRTIALLANLFFGWTVIGWFVAWFFAFHERESSSDDSFHAPGGDIELWQ